MSSNHLSNTASAARRGNIEHIGRLADQLGGICSSSEYSDITLIVEGQRIPAHRVILAARSDYFRALLYGGLKESTQREVELKDTPVLAFQALLKYVYTGYMGLSSMREDTVLDTLGLAHQFGFVDLENAVSEYLRQILSLRNVCAILDAARLYGLKALMKVCYVFLDKNAKDILENETLFQLSQESMCELLHRDSFLAPELDIFQAVVRWCALNNQGDIPLLMGCVRLSLLSVKDLLSVVRPARLIDAEKLLDAIEEKIIIDDVELPHRGQLLVEENAATLRLGSRVLHGEMRSALLDGETQVYDMERGYTRHAISDTEDQGIVIKLGIPSIVNHIRMLLWDKDTRAYSYYIEVSVDQYSWERVVDHKGYLCRSWQYLYFATRTVQYVKIVGTNNTANKVFHLVSLEVMYTVRVPNLLSGIVVPAKNVATQAMSATVVQGVSRSRDALLNGDIHHYDWDSGYTCHQLGSGSIIVQLGQPYVIGSLRMLLWDCDDRSYSYYVETSLDSEAWHMVVDKRNEQCQSWQTLTFSPLPVVFIKIVGTNNTANEVFHCVHLECPAQTGAVECSHLAPIAVTEPPIAPATPEIVQEPEQVRQDIEIELIEPAPQQQPC